jgi:hypothetical protein
MAEFIPAENAGGHDVVGSDVFGARKDLQKRVIGIAHEHKRLDKARLDRSQMIADEIARVRAQSERSRGLYVEAIEALRGREGFLIRDEIREAQARTAEDQFMVLYQNGTFAKTNTAQFLCESELAEAREARRVALMQWLQETYKGAVIYEDSGTLKGAYTGQIYLHRG